MKKIICLILAFVLAACALCACGKGSETEKLKKNLSLDGNVLAFVYAQEGTSVVACSEKYSDKYTEAKVMEYTLKAENGVLTVIGAQGTYSGEYSFREKGDGYAVYSVKIGEDEGFASLTLKEHEDGTAEYLLLLTISGYSTQFASGKFTV